MKKHNLKRFVSMLLALVLCMGFMTPASAVGVPGMGTNLRVMRVDNSEVSASPLTHKLEETQEPAYASTDIVRVSIVLKDDSTISAGFAVEKIADNAEAMDYRANLKMKQESVQARIEKTTGTELDVAWNLTLAANIISANVPYGQIQQIEQVAGVEGVYLENRYDPAVVTEETKFAPNTATSGAMIGTHDAYAAGYTGAGSRVAVIDTGLDADHQSFDAGAFDHSLEEQAAKTGKNAADYDLLDADEIAAHLSQLHVNGYYSADQLYVNSKIPFGYNYLDVDVDITHDRDQQGDHGTHVAGIATANAYIPGSDGTYVDALDAVQVQGVAPDAQILVMKVFGKAGGAYESDYMAAIEDAIVLNCDSINLSLGAPNPGNSTPTPIYQEIMDDLAACGTVVAISSGNSGAWPTYSGNIGYLYADDVSMQTNGAPGSHTNALTVASVDNAGYTGLFFLVGNSPVFYVEGSGNNNQPLSSLVGEHRYVLIDGFGTASDWAAVGEAMEGAVAVCSRGEIGFADKANNAVEAGAAALVVYDNEVSSGFIMDLTGYDGNVPCVSVTQEDADTLRYSATAVNNGYGDVLYYEGEMTVQDGLGNIIYDTDHYTMSEFSSWGIPGSLEMKPEITAPGGNIYSSRDGDTYGAMSGTSMASPQVAGMAALVAQYIRENGLTQKTGVNARHLAQSLLMSTATPLIEEHDDGAEGYYSLLWQGAGLADVGRAVSADSYILMGADATDSYADGKVKAELKDDPEKTGVYSFSFSINNLKDEAKTYNLSADFFTQDIFTNIVNSRQDLGEYMDIWTTPLDMDVTFSTGNTVTVAANGSVKVTVTATLTAGQKAALNEEYPTGAYIEGFVYIEGNTTDEGVKGTKHSIPVLGFYGNWTDPSMFEVGSYPEYECGNEIRAPYVGSTYTNCLGVSYATSPLDVFAYGGNPVVADSTYMPERNAISNTSGDVIRSIVFTSIRNASAGRFQMKNLTSGQVLNTIDYPAIDCAFYYDLAGMWYNTQENLSLFEYVPEGNEGDQLMATLTLAPEYYVDENGQVDWDALGEGASLSVPMVIDNTAPEVIGDISISDNTLTVSVRDNQYVAGVALYNGSGTTNLTHTGSKQDIEPNELAEFTLDLTGVNGTRFLLQVYDYAMNTTTYMINQQIGTPGTLPDMIRFTPSYMIWAAMTLNATTSDMITTYAESQNSYLAATIADHYVFAATYDKLFVMPESDLTDTTQISDLATPLHDMAYNAADGEVYAVDADSRLVIVDKLTGEIRDVGKIGSEEFVTNSLACDKDGNFYTNEYGTSYVYKFTLDSMSEPEQVVSVWGNPADFASDNAQSMEVDPNTGKLIWQSYAYIKMYGGLYNLIYAYLFEIDPADNYAVTRHSDLYYLGTSLIIPDKSGTPAGDWLEPTENVTDILLNKSEMTMWKGSQENLQAFVQPWTAKDRSVTWTSSNEAVAKVNSQGLVTAVGAGTCMITATSKLDPTVSSTCTVTVNAIPVTLTGVLQDEDGATKTFSWDLEYANTWTPGVALETGDMIAATYDTINDKLYVLNSDQVMHKVDPSTGKTEQTAGLTLPFWDLQYSKYMSSANSPKVSGLYSTYFYPCRDPMNIGGKRFDASSNLANWGASCFVASASLGYTVYSNNYDPDRDCERFVLLDDIGGLWNMYVYWDEAAQEYAAARTIRYTGDLNIAIPGYNDYYKFCSMIADEEGALYLSVFNGNSTDLYRIEIDDENQTARSFYIGNMGSGTWPVSLCNVEINEGCPHMNTETRGAKEATCTETGYTGDVYCLDCGELVTQGAETPLADHVMGEWTVSKPVTCNEEGEESRKCANCDYTETREVPMTGHEYAASTVAPTCTAEGYTQYSCIYCEHNYREDFTPALGHAYEEEKVEPTCTEAGYTVHTCKTCQHSYVDSIVSALGHDYTKQTVEPTHDKMGYTTYTCSACDHSYVSDYTDALGHDFTQTVTTEPTCTNEGVMTFICDCGKSYTQPIPRSEHQYNSVVTEPDCTSMGYTTHTCAVCGDCYQDSFVDARGHDYDVTVAAPTCTGYGYTEYACKNCEHSHVSDIVQPLGHTWTEWTVVTEATCFTDGEESCTCKTCGESQTRAMEKNTGNCPGKAFVDLNTHEWYHEAVDFVLRGGLMKGMSEDAFSPNGNLTRAQLVTILYRMAGEPSVEGLESPFKDVPANAWYANAIIWAANNGIVIGKSDTIFDPTAATTREQIATILFRYTGAEKAGENHLIDYTDGNKVSLYAVEAMNWAVASGLITSTSTSDHVLNPEGNATRAQIAMILMRYFKMT